MFVPLEQVFRYPNNIHAMGLFLVYAFIISGWIGYHRSISKNPHKGALGNVRYVIDLAIIFLVYYLVSIANPSSNARFGEAFEWVFPTIFALYLAWDIVKVLEYKQTRTSNMIRAKRTVITGVILVAFLAQASSYNIASHSSGITSIPDSNKITIDIAYIVTSLILIGMYRASKWEIKVSLPRNR